MEVHGRSADYIETNDFSGMETLCQPCKFENRTTTAIGMCLQCDENICNLCFFHHLKRKLCRNHELVDINMVSSSSDTSKENVEECKRHENEKIKFYCQVHDIVGCGDCIILGHGTCNPKYIKDLSVGFRENKQFKDLLEKLDQMDRARELNAENSQKNRKECKVMYEDALNETRTFRTEVIKYLDTTEAYIISEIEQLKSKNDAFLDNLQQSCEQLSSKIKALKQTLNLQSHRENILFIHVVNSKPVLREIEKEVAMMETDTRNKVKHFKFVPNEELASLVSSTRKLGFISTHEDSIESEVVDSRGSGVEREKVLNFVSDEGLFCKESYHKDRSNVLSRRQKRNQERELRRQWEEKSNLDYF